MVLLHFILVLAENLSLFLQPDVAFPLQPPELLNSSNKASLSVIHSLLHDEIDSFCKLVYVLLTLKSLLDVPPEF